MAKYVPRILSQLDRDSHSPTFGSFDRDFWHYKIRDFSSVVLQQGMIVLHVLKHHAADQNEFNHHPALGRWVSGCLAFWAKSQLNSGSFNEYYPFEHGYPPTAFSLYAAGWVLRSGEYQATPEVTKAIQKAIRWLIAHKEQKAFNQEMAGLAGIALCSHLPGITIDQGKYEQRLDDFFNSQSDEGWFSEYDGPDLGYLSVTLDCLYDYYLVSRDPRAAQAMTRAVDFMHSMLPASGALPVMINSRNTGYVVPYGIVRLAEHNPKAAELFSRLFSTIDNPKHFLHKTDDRYTCHYLLQSCFRALPYLDQVKHGEVASAGTSQKYFDESGIYIEHRVGNSILINARKGGVVYVYDHDGIADCDYGWRVKYKNHCAVSHWQDCSYVCEYTPKTLTIKGRLSKHGWIVPSVYASIGLRLASLVFGNRLIPLLKNIMIFNTKSSGVSFVRVITIQDETLEIRDAFKGRADLIQQLEPAPHYSLRHVASAGSFEYEELLYETIQSSWEKLGAGVFSRTLRLNRGEQAP